MKKKEELELTEGGFYYCETINTEYKWVYQKSKQPFKTSCTFCISDGYFGEGEKITIDDNVRNLRVATNEEQQLLITQIKNHGK